MPSTKSIATLPQATSLPPTNPPAETLHMHDPNHCPLTPITDQLADHDAIDCLDEHVPQKQPPDRFPTDRSAGHNAADEPNDCVAATLAAQLADQPTDCCRRPAQRTRCRKPPLSH